MKDKIKLDYKIIADLITPGARVLDLGCGDGELIDYLSKTKNAEVQGVELNESAIHKCVEKGLTVYHSDIDSGLSGYPDKSFEYCILNQTFQEIKKIAFVMDEAFRIADKVIVGFPNFANLSSRLSFLFHGHAPVTNALPYKWHDTPNLRFLSINDFNDFCREKKYDVLKSFYLTENSTVNIFPNLFAQNAIYLLKLEENK